MPLEILHISESDVLGGAARTAHKLHAGLNTAGHRSRMLVGRRGSDDADVRSIKRGPAWRVADRAAGTLADRAGFQYAGYPSSFGVALDPWFRRSNVVQLHNLHGSYFSFTALPLLSRRRPTVWLLQDQWAFTGHVTYSLDCDRWETGCGQCPYLHAYPRLRRDTTAALWRAKRAVYARSTLTLVVPSVWMADLVARSPLLARHPVHRIPHGVDTEVFRPVPRDEARRSLGLPSTRPIVFFCASDLNEPRKGLDLLAEALSSVEAKPLLVLAGAGRAPEGIEHVHLGAIPSDAALARVYAAADVLAVPTVADALTQTAIESIACGTPCVSFDRGGVIDVVRPGETGFHARFGDARDLARSIEAALAHGGKLGARCRDVAEREFGVRLQVDRYVSLYEQVVGDR